MDMGFVGRFRGGSVVVGVVRRRLVLGRVRFWNFFIFIF